MTRVRRVLVACEFSGTVREAFAARGWDAWSCDLLPTDRPSVKHLQCDVLQLLTRTHGAWDLMIAHPPCTHLAISGARWWPGKLPEQRAAVEFVRALMSCGIPKIAIENPIGHLSTAIRKPDQIIQPWQFGHGETKATCLWLRGLPLLVPSNIVGGRSNRMHMMPDTKDRWKKRSVTYPGIATAMADQWG